MRELIPLEHEWDIRSVDWPQLTSESVVVEVGGFHGRWAQHIQERYHPIILVFEPQKWLIPELRERLPGATVCNYGLWDKDAGDVPMSEYGTDGASFVNLNDRQPGIGELWEIGGIFRSFGIRHNIALMLMNIEGGEHVLLPHMFKQRIYPATLVIQTHGTPHEQRALRQIIARHYTNLWDYGCTLSAWQHKEARR